jgi:hypothetical protein
MDNNKNQTNSRVSFTQNLATSAASVTSPLRRSRADTMPSQSSAFPYASDIFSDLTLPTDTTATTNSNNSNVNLNNISGGGNVITSRHRSGSVTLPNEVYHDSTTTTTSSFSQTPFGVAAGYNPYDPSSPIDENASNTIASTLASLGLDDEEGDTPHSSYGGDHEEGHGNTHLSRARSYTIAGQLSQANDIAARLGGNFSPFSPHTRSSVLHRPRAISLGMADSPISNAFSPFEMTSTSGEAKPSTLQQTRFSNASGNIASTPLRSSRSSSNLVDLNADNMYMNDDDYSYQVSRRHCTVFPVAILTITIIGILWST